MMYLSPWPNVLDDSGYLLLEVAATSRCWLRQQACIQAREPVEGNLTTIPCTIHIRRPVAMRRCSSEFRRRGSNPRPRIALPPELRRKAIYSKAFLHIGEQTAPCFNLKAMLPIMPYHARGGWSPKDYQEPHRAQYHICIPRFPNAKVYRPAQNKASLQALQTCIRNVLLL